MPSFDPAVFISTSLSFGGGRFDVVWTRGLTKLPVLRSKRIEHQRWKMFGHFLRSMENTPAQTALSFAIESDNLFIGRLGIPRMNLF